MKKHIGFINHDVKHPHLKGNIAHHDRKNKLRIDFDDKDWQVLREIFEDDDTTSAVVDIIHNAPPEIQILAVQTLKMIEEVE